jgi:hypothetical protein
MWRSTEWASLEKKPLSSSKLPGNCPELSRPPFHVAQALVVVQVDMDAFEIGQLELPYGALFQDREPRLALRTEAQRLGDHHGIRARDVLHIAFDRLNAFDLEAEMFESWWFRIVPDKILHLPRKNEERYATVTETVAAATAVVRNGQLMTVE